MSAQNHELNFETLEERIKSIQNRVENVEKSLRWLLVEFYIFEDFMIEIIPAIYMKKDLKKYLKDTQRMIEIARERGQPLWQVIRDLESAGKLPSTMARFTKFSEELRKILKDTARPL